MEVLKEYQKGELLSGQGVERPRGDKRSRGIKLNSNSAYIPRTIHKCMNLYERTSVKYKIFSRFFLKKKSSGPIYESELRLSTLTRKKHYIFIIFRPILSEKNAF